jgi:hygromycin-B 4-O-kinase
MISKKIKGEESTHHRQRLDIIKEIGRLAAIIHTIPTKGYGHLFDWSQNTLSKNDTWNDYLDCELNATERIMLLHKHKMISVQTGKRMNAVLNKMRKWKQSPCLQHGDLRLKNTMVDTAGKITAIIDWENCISSIGPYWDTSIALHDLSMDAQWKFLEGYGMTSQKLSEISPVIKLFNLLNYAPSIERIVKEKDKNQLEHYRARMQGMLDLFSL